MNIELTQLEEIGLVIAATQFIVSNGECETTQLLNKIIKRLSTIKFLKNKKFPINEVTPDNESDIYLFLENFGFVYNTAMNMWIKG